MFCLGCLIYVTRKQAKAPLSARSRATKGGFEFIVLTLTQPIYGRTNLQARSAADDLVRARLESHNANFSNCPVPGARKNNRHDP